jgi:hypothetical protein
MAAARSRLVNGASLAGWSKSKPWRARIYIAGRHISLGYYATREEAKAAHAEAVRERLGERYLKGAAHADWSDSAPRGTSPA